jgi:hypothetical protein
VFRKFFAARSSRPLESKRSRRLELEVLEDRLTPATFTTGPFPADLMGNLPTSGPINFAPVPASTPTFATTGFTTAGFQVPFSSTSAGFAPTGSANTTAVANTQSQLTQLEQAIGTLFPIAAARNGPAATSLVIDEVFLAVDTFSFFLSQEHSVFSPSFQDLPAHENAINRNPLELTSIGRELGSMVFQATADLLALNSSHAGVGV